MGKTSIEWTRGDDGSMGETWNPVRGCSRVSPGCERCYAERIATRFSGPGQPYQGLVTLRQPKNGSGPTHGGTGVPRTGVRGVWSGRVRLAPKHLADPLKWRRPRRVFVNSMSDLFHERLINEEIAAVFGVMAYAPRHTFQVLTKRPERMREWFAWAQAQTPIVGYLYQYAILASQGAVNGFRNYFPAWPLANVHLGVSVEDRLRLARLDDLREIPAAVRFVSIEPLLEDLGQIENFSGISWAIVGAESGPGARPCDLAWVRSIVEQCRAAGVPVFVKQLQLGGKLVKDIAQFPADLRVREFPRSNP